MSLFKHIEGKIKSTDNVNYAIFGKNRNTNEGEYGGETLTNLASGRGFCSPILQYVNYFRVTRKIKQDDIVVDVGAGCCELLKILYSNRIKTKYIGLEVNKHNFNKGLELVKKVNNSKNYKALLLKKDLTKGIPLRDNISDNTVCSLVMEHMRKDDGINLFKEMVRVTKVMGLIHITIPYHEGFTPDNEHLYEWKMKEFLSMVKKYKNINLVDIFYIEASVNQIKKSSQRELYGILKSRFHPIFLRLMIPSLFDNSDKGNIYYALLQKTK